MLLSEKPATGWGRLVRIVVLLCAITMVVTAASTIEEGTGGFTSPRHRMLAGLIILSAAALAIAVAFIAWWHSRPAN